MLFCEQKTTKHFTDLIFDRKEMGNRKEYYLVFFFKKDQIKLISIRQINNFMGFK